MKILFIFLLLSFKVFGACDDSQTEAIKYQHRNSPLKITFLNESEECRYSLSSDIHYSQYLVTPKSNNLELQDGISIEWFRQSFFEKATSQKIKHREFAYKDGKLNGPYTIWHKNGTRKEEGSYIDNSKNGIIKTYDDKGKLESESDYVYRAPAEVKITNKHIKLKETWNNTKKIESSVPLLEAKKEIQDIAARYCSSLKAYPVSVQQICEPCETKNFLNTCKKHPIYQCNQSEFFTVRFFCFAQTGDDSSLENYKEQEKKVVEEKDNKEKKSLLEIAKKKCVKLGFKEKTEDFGICVLEFLE